MRVCILTTAHLCNNPRVVKEADALHEAGHQVRVVAYDRWEHYRVLDRALTAARGWRWEPVPVGPEGSRWYWLATGALERAARAGYRRGLQGRIIRDLALSKHARRLAAVAAREPADLVIAHHAPALPAAALAAARLGARMGFDAEDLHAEDFAEREANAMERELIAAAERAYLGDCAALTASSPLIADELVTRYGVARPATILNAFPLAERDESARCGNVASRTPSLYWFSQVIGPHRGLEEVLEAIGMMRRRVRLHLRGWLDPSFEPTLRSMIAALPANAEVLLSPRIAPGELVRDAQRHDIGLALERPVSRNREICITNKMFVYLAAGLAIAATDTPGQRWMLDQVPDAGLLHAPGDVTTLAANLDALLRSPERLAAAKSAALAAARARFCWEVEQQNLVAYLERAMSGGDESRLDRSVDANERVAPLVHLR